MRLLQIILIAFISLTISVNYSDSVAATATKASKSSSHSGKKSHGRSKGRRSAKIGAGNVWDRIRLGIRIPRPAPVSAEYSQMLAANAKNLSAPSPESTKTTGISHNAKDEIGRLNTVIAPNKLHKGELQLVEKLRARHLLSPQNNSQNKTDLRAPNRYTQLGRSKFGVKEPTSTEAERYKNIHSASTSNKGKALSQLKSPSLQRIRTRLGLQPGLDNSDDNPGSETAGQNISPEKIAKIKDKLKRQQQIALGKCSDLNTQNIKDSAKHGALPESYTQLAAQCTNQQNSNYARVSKHIAGYSHHKGFLLQSAERARPFLYHVVDALNKYNMPMDLALLPIVESGYQATALSNKDAAGIWQFIPGTGREYGLQQSLDYDARLDITASTNAAIRFLAGLNGHYKGDWLLSLAAYNSGQGTVDAAIARNQAEGLDTDFWSLALPAETQEYVPRLLALATIFSNPGSYGVKLRPLKNEPYFIKVNIDHETDINILAEKDLSTIAKLANFDVAEFGLLNSAYLKPNLIVRKPLTFLMPISNANQLHQSLAFMAHTYKDESTTFPLFIKLAKANRTKTHDPLLSINIDESPQRRFTTGQLAQFKAIKDELTAGNEAVKNKKLEDGEDWAVHYLDKGESLKTIAEYHGISETLLRSKNNFKPKQTISLGQRLLIPLKQLANIPVKNSGPSIFNKSFKANFDSPRLWL